MDLSIVVPARNERALIRGSLERIARTVDALGVEYEIILGDSGSTDGTADAASESCLDQLRVVRDPLPGKGRILTRALGATRGDVVGFIDADLEISEAYIPDMYVELLKGADAAIASKRPVDEDGQGRPLHRRLMTAMVNRSVRLAFGTPFSDHQAGLKFFRGTLLRSVLPRVTNTGWLWDTEVLVYLARAGADVAEIPVNVTSRPDSHLAFGRSWFGALRDLSALFVRSRLAYPSPVAQSELATAESRGGLL